MGVPKISASRTNGAIGAKAAGAFGVSALCLTGVAVVDKIGLNDPKLINSLDEAEALGIEETGDNAGAWKQIRDFYLGYDFIAGTDRAEVYIILLSETVPLADALDINEADNAKKLLDYAKRRVRYLGVARTPPDAYTPDQTNGIDQDSIDALITGQALALNYATAKNAPLHIFIEGRAFQKANIGDIENLKEHTQGRCSIVLGAIADEPTAGASVGLALGVKAAGGPSRNLGEIAAGALPIAEGEAWIGDTKAEDATDLYDTLHDRGYIFLMTETNREGYFFNDDPTAVRDADDYSTVANNAVVNELQRTMVETLTEWKKRRVQLIVGGKLDPGVIATIEGEIDRDVNSVLAGEISNSEPGSRHGFIDKDQNVASTRKIEVVGKVRPFGYLKDIDIKFGFEI